MDEKKEIYNYMKSGHIFEYDSGSMAELPQIFLPFSSLEHDNGIKIHHVYQYR